jgi:hypothetical protein
MSEATDLRRDLEETKSEWRRVRTAVIQAAGLKDTASDDEVCRAFEILCSELKASGVDVLAVALGLEDVAAAVDARRRGVDPFALND